MFFTIRIAFFASLFVLGTSLECFQGWSDHDPALLPCNDDSACCYQFAIGEQVSASAQKKHVFFGCSAQEIHCEDHVGVNGEQCFTSSGIKTCVCQDANDPMCQPGGAQ